MSYFSNKIEPRLFLMTRRKQLLVAGPSSKIYDKQLELGLRFAHVGFSCF